MPGHEPFAFHSLDELRERIRELSLFLDVTSDLSPLVEPLQVGRFRLPNRFVVLPMEGCDGTAEGAPDDLTFRRYRRFAAGGAGLLWMEATAVVPQGRANPRQLWLHRGVVPQFAKLVEETRRAATESLGQSHRPMLIVQLTHSGRYSRPERAPAPIIAHHSLYLDPIHKLPADYPLISDAELERLEDSYVEAALCARDAGFDGVDVKACHRYLVSELLASFTREGSVYGGAAFENRSRFIRNVVRKIRQAAPDLLVSSRMNVYDAMAYPYGFGVSKEDPVQPALEEPIELVRFLKENGAPLVNITIGNPYFNPHVNRPFDLPSVGGAIPPEPPLVGVARFAGIVRQIQEASSGMAVIGGGYSWLRHFFPNVAAAHVRNGWVSLVGAGRMAFAYPNFARDVMEKGRLDPQKACVACSACTQIMRDGGRSGCVPRDAEIYEPIYKAGRAEALDTIREMALTCRQCNSPTCTTRCPAQVNIPRFIDQIVRQEFRAAYETIREANMLAAVCGYVCPSETLCEAGCINQHYSETVPIRHLQRWVSRKAVEEGWAAEPRAQAVPTGKRVAVLGAGPGGYRRGRATGDGGPRGDPDRPFRRARRHGQGDDSPGPPARFRVAARNPRRACFGRRHAALAQGGTRRRDEPPLHRGRGLRCRADRPGAERVRDPAGRPAGDGRIGRAGVPCQSQGGPVHFAGGECGTGNWRRQHRRGCRPDGEARGRSRRGHRLPPLFRGDAGMAAGTR